MSLLAPPWQRQYGRRWLVPAAPGARVGARVIGIPAGAGLDPDRLEHVVRTHRPAMVYLIPAHHNPTGLVMPAGHRRRVARLAAAHPDTLFVDDMTMAELPLGDHPAPPRWPPSRPGSRTWSASARCPSSTGAGCGPAGSGPARA